MKDVQIEPKSQEMPKSPGRIPVVKIWLHETIDLPGGNTIMEVVDCSPQKVPGRQFFVAHFVPAHQVIELEWYKNERAEPYRTRLAMSLIKRFD